MHEIDWNSLCNMALKNNGIDTNYLSSTSDTDDDETILPT